MIRIILLLAMAVLVQACSYIPKLDEVLPDKRTEYRKSEALPDLEVPPDLTATEGTGAMSIPGEATLSEYRRQGSERSNPDGTGQAGQTAVTNYNRANLPSATPTAGENWVLVQGSTADAWPILGRYFSDQGYALELSDAELGVLGTDWSQPLREQGFIYRDKYKIFSEAGQYPGTLVLFITSMRQEQVYTSSGSSQWIDQSSNPATVQQLVTELDSFFNGTSRVVTTAPAYADPVPQPGSTQRTSASGGAQIEQIGNGRAFLNLPEEFSFAWRRTENALQAAGMVISSMNQSEGIYTITYYQDGKQEKKKGWMSRLKFWDKDDGQQAGSEYQISLTGVGNKTELIVLDSQGNWDNSEEAGLVLELIRDYYNRS